MSHYINTININRYIFVAITDHRHNYYDQSNVPATWYSQLLSTVCRVTACSLNVAMLYIDIINW